MVDDKEVRLRCLEMLASKVPGQPDPEALIGRARVLAEYVTGNAVAPVERVKRRYVRRTAAPPAKAD